jgi:hypothetical protein
MVGTSKWQKGINIGCGGKFPKNGFTVELSSENVALSEQFRIAMAFISDFKEDLNKLGN